MTTKISTFLLEIIEEKNSDLSVSLIIDGIDFGKDIIDLEELKKSAIFSGAYNLQTCGCGVAGCAGFFEPIFVQHTNDYVIWEFDSNYHPVPKKQGDISTVDLQILKFNRSQYILEIQQKFEFIRNHPKRKTIDPYCDFDNKIFDKSFPDLSVLHTPFEKGATIVVGYTDDFKQPFAWVENQSKLYPMQIMPTALIWSMFGEWTSLFESGDFAYHLLEDISIEECNQKIQRLANEIQRFWGSCVCVVWEELPNNFYSESSDYNTHRISSLFKYILDAAYNGKCQVIRDAVANGFDLNTPNSDKSFCDYILSEAISELSYPFENKPYRYEIVKLLLELGANPNQLDIEKSGALTNAMIAMDTEMVRILLEAGANPNHYGGFSESETFYDYAEFDYRYRIYEMNNYPEQLPTYVDEDSWLLWLDKIAIKYNKRRPDHLFLLRQCGAKTTDELNN